MSRGRKVMVGEAASPERVLRSTTNPSVNVTWLT
jgi:hypothetical protein